jgi:uncharacterized protein (TIGR03790 family)
MQGARAAGLLLAAALALPGLDREQVVVIVNESSADSRAIAEYYVRARGIPARQVCRIRTTAEEEIGRAEYDREIAAPVRQFLKQRGLNEQILCLVTTRGVPLKVRGGGGGRKTTAASVDSELTTLYLDRAGELAGPLPNPYYQSRKPFTRKDFPMYLVTRLTGYTVADAKALVDRSLLARNAGVVALDQRGSLMDSGDIWLGATARVLPKERVRLEGTKAVLTGLKNVIGYASWGSNDGNRKERDPGLGWLPGGLATQYVSTDGRTFREPPPGWRLTTWADRGHHWAGSPQSLTGDFIRQGATGASGHVYEPYLVHAPRPQILFRAYLLEGRTLAESFWASIPALSWMNIVVGDPLCRVGAE